MTCHIWETTEMTDDDEIEKKSDILPFTSRQLANVPLELTEFCPCSVGSKLLKMRNGS